MTNTQKIKVITWFDRQGKRILTALGLISLLAGCRVTALTGGEANAQTDPSPTPTKPPLPTSSPIPVTPTPPPTSTPLPTITLSPTPWPTPTVWPTATPWSTPAAWAPTAYALPTLAPLPVAPNVANAAVDSMAPAVAPNHGLAPVSYAPPDGVDVFGGTILRWEFMGQLAPDEFFDIKIKPLGSNDSVFVEWTKTKEYELHPWDGWVPGVYTWQIGVIKGQLVGETKHFTADLARDSQPMIIKWQPAGQGSSGNGGGGAPSGGGSGGS